MATEAEKRLAASQRALGLTRTTIPSRYTDAEDRSARREARNEAKREREARKTGASTDRSSSTSDTPVDDEDVQEAIRSIQGNAEEKAAMESVMRSLGMIP